MIRYVFATLILLSGNLLAFAERIEGRGESSAAPWPQWRGPARDGISRSTGLLHKWPDDGPPLEWKAEGLGSGFSSVAVAGGRAFTIGDEADGQYLIALRIPGGKEGWRTRIGEPWNGSYTGSRSTPTVDGDRVYVLGTDGDLVCAATATGRVIWRRNLQKDFGGRSMSVWAFSESPLVDGDKVVCTPGGPEAGIVALNKTNGSQIWRCKIPEFGSKGADGAGYSSIVVTHGADTKQYVQLTGRGVVGVRAKDGKFLWGYDRIASGTANIPTPLVHGDCVFCSNAYNSGTALLRLSREGGEVKATEEYFIEPKTLQNHHGQMLMIGDYVYCGHGQKNGAPVCIEWRTGKIAWRERRGAGRGSAAAAFADGDLYFRYEDGTMALIRATPDAYELVSTFEIPGVEQPSWAHPVIADGRLYLREQDVLLVYDIRTH